MGEEGWLISMAYPTLLKPVLKKLEETDSDSSRELKKAFEEIEGEIPGFTADFIKSIMKRAEIEHEVNLPELLLRLEPENELYEAELTRNETPFPEINERTTKLKKILGRIPDEIEDRKKFLETIKEIASAIRMLLESVNAVLSFVQEEEQKKALDAKKREFVKHSKKFSHTLKDFFRDSELKNEVFISANYLVHQTNVILTAVKESC